MTTLPREPSTGEYDDGVISLRACVRRKDQDEQLPKWCRKYAPVNKESPNDQ